MVPDSPSPSRRQFLGGLTGAAGATVAVGATAPTALPDVLTDQATRYYPTPPEITTHWRPTVTEGHAREAVTLLEETVSRGRTLWQRLDTRERFSGAGGWLDDARQALQNGTYHEALFDARYGIQFAGEALGIALARLDRVDFDALEARETALLDRARQVVDDLRPYPVADAPRDLAWCYRIEREIALGRLNVPWSRRAEARTDGDEPGSDARAHQPWEVGEILAGLLQGEIHIRSAERYRDLLSRKLSGSTTAYADHLEDVASRFLAEIERFPGRDAVLDNYIGERDDGETTPYEFAHSRLARWCFDTGYLVLDHNEDLLVYPTIERSRGLARRRAHEFAVGHLVVEEGDTTFDSGHTLAEKHRARATYRSVVGSTPPPLLVIQARRAIEDLQVAKVGFAGSYQRPVWRERLQAYLYALVGRAKLDEYPAVYDTVADGP